MTRALRTPRRLSVLAGALLLVATAAWLLRSQPPTPAPRAAERGPEIRPVPDPTAPTPMKAIHAATRRDHAPRAKLEATTAKPEHDGEAALMTRLRELGNSDPERSLELARDANARFSHSDDAPERNWFLIKALVNLGRFEEARAEARVMVDTYRDTPWALDVERHLLVHPPSTPGSDDARALP